ncbi:hypothetical protein [Undibacterium flavidum]|uniref:Uncharacterized protein n=1 Tax=Undibacterium flavidum TaxID=2762297 RepID=A0ABR6Y887_9BURK|nr:hypothetical protein [Undibacterium flavidum]MBC3872825.1 hypothetical protein [Undibacterium flavidum]
MRFLFTFVDYQRFVGREWPDRLDYSPTNHFSCFAKKSKQKKATTLPLPFGFPIVQDKKWESVETRFAQTTPLSLSIFCPAQLAVSEVDESQKQIQKQHQNNQCRQILIFPIAVVGSCF